jgi:hypothetical protein
METSRPGPRAGLESRARNKSDGQSSSSPLPPSFSNEVSQVKAQAAQAADAATSLTADVKDAAKTATRAVKQQASQFAADVGHELSKTVEDQKTRGVEAIQCFARAISSAAAELEGQSPQVARSVRDAAAKVEGLSGNLSNHSVDQLLKAATDLARQQPMLFIGGAVAAGFALSRFLKSSATNGHAADEKPSMSAQ